MSIKRNHGFTLVELVIVVVILGLLAVTALPRFFSAQDQAETATVEGVSGGIASAISIIRAQWELEARPNGNVGGNANQTQISYDSTFVGVDGSTGYPTGSASNTDTRASAATAQTCLEVFNLLLQSPPSAAVTGASFKSFVYAVAHNGSTCHYYHTNTITAAPADNSTPSATGSKGFSYDLTSGRVTIFSN